MKITDLLNGNDAAWMDDPRRPCLPPRSATPMQIRDHCDAWFPTTSQGGPGQARRLCASCPSDIKDACLAYALENNEWGIWGGTNEEGRKRLKKKAAA